MKNKIETVTIELRTDYAYQLALFLGVQDIEDTSYIINKYNLNMNKDEVDDILQNLFKSSLILSFSISINSVRTSTFF